jgi:oligosaccharide repeat unit polymerase
VGLLLIDVTLPEGDALSVFAYAGYEILALLFVFVILEGNFSIQSMLRMDYAMLLSLYVLTFGEFLIPRPLIMLVGHVEDPASAVSAVSLMMASIAVGRFLVRHRAPQGLGLPQARPGFLACALVIAWLAGFSYPLWTSWNEGTTIVEGALRGRWDKPWARGDLGGAESFISQLILLHYLVCALAGHLMAGDNRLGIKILSASVATTTILFSFTEGTRNIFIIYGALFVGGWLTGSSKTSKTLFVSTVLGLFVLGYIGSAQMLRFRDEGLGQYISTSSVSDESIYTETMVDNNLIALSSIINVFPSQFEYLYGEITLYSLGLPIPRALWPGKPEKLSVSTTEALGLSGLSIAVTAVGEAYMSWGYAGIVIFGLALGAFASWWERLSGGRSNLDRILYISGFFAAAITMRSLLFFTTALLPALTVLVCGRLLARFQPAMKRPARVGEPP